MVIQIMMSVSINVLMVNLVTIQLTFVCLNVHLHLIILAIQQMGVASFFVLKVYGHKLVPGYVLRIVQVLNMLIISQELVPRHVQILHYQMAHCSILLMLMIPQKDVLMSVHSFHGSTATIKQINAYRYAW